MSKDMRSTASLACFTGEPLFPETLSVGRPQSGDTDRFFDRLRDMFSRNWLTNHGPMVQELEAAVEVRLDVKHAIAFCNGTVALEMMLRAQEIKGEVIVPSFTFIATVHAIRAAGLMPVFSDIGSTHLLDPDAVERAVTPNTAAILGVHTWGQGCEIERLQFLADQHGLKLLFDAAHAFDCTYRGRPLGGFGVCEAFSLHATKVFHSFEGGLVTTQDDAVAHRLRLMRNFGFSDYDTVVCAGGNGKLSEPAAAMALTNLESLSSFISVNRELHEVYRRSLQGIPGVGLLDYDPRERQNHQYVVLEIDQDGFGMSRDQLLRILQAENILARRYFYPSCHRMEPYRTLDPEAGHRLPVTTSLCERVLVLPTGGQIAPIDAEDIAHLIGFCQREAGAIRARWEHDA